LTRRPKARSLWLCISFPELCLHAVGSPRKAPAAVLADEKGGAMIYACNAKAGHAGVSPGMPLNAALALCPNLDIRQRQEGAEKALLHARANWALAYTPLVSIEPEGALLLELSGSLRLFGGFEVLRKRLAEELHGSSCCAALASAPFARAALWLARANKDLHCNEPSELIGVFAGLPLVCLGWPLKLQQQLLRMGVQTVGDCLRLPRDGLARRIGPSYLHELDQALGRRPEILVQHRPRQVFADSLELGYETFIVAEIAGALRELVGALSVVLTQNQVSAQCLRIQLQHLNQPSTSLEVRLREPCASANHFIELLDLQLESQSLIAPVSGVSLSATLIPDFLPSSGDLLRGETAVAEGVSHDASEAFATRFIDRLRARVGAQSVHGLNLVAEHRPEYAWEATEPCAQTGAMDVPGGLIGRLRPLWLLGQPERLRSRDGIPVYGGELLFLSDAERIESGWWDGRDIRRDYYAVVDRSGRRFWVYRDCHSDGWFLHGFFG
jgi:protein ImuB